MPFIVLSVDREAYCIRCSSATLITYRLYQVGGLLPAHGLFVIMFIRPVLSSALLLRAHVLLDDVVSPGSSLANKRGQERTRWARNIIYGRSTD